MTLTIDTENIYLGKAVPGEGGGSINAYTKDETDELLVDKLNTNANNFTEDGIQMIKDIVSDDFATKEELDNKLDKKQDLLSEENAGDGININSYVEPFSINDVYVKSGNIGTTTYTAVTKKTLPTGVDIRTMDFEFKVKAAYKNHAPSEYDVGILQLCDEQGNIFDSSILQVKIQTGGIVFMFAGNDIITYWYGYNVDNKEYECKFTYNAASSVLNTTVIDLETGEIKSNTSINIDTSGDPIYIPEEYSHVFLRSPAERSYYGLAYFRSYFDSYKIIMGNTSLSAGKVITKISAELEPIREKLAEIEAARFVNATVIGEPTIIHGQVSGFSTASYLIFPTILDFHNQGFEFEFAFTPSDNVQVQQNILDSRFGLALAIKDGKGLMAVSTNGTSWDAGQAVGTFNIQANTTHYAKVSWNRLQYKTQITTTKGQYTDDMTIVNTTRPFPTTIYIGGCNTTETGHDPHPFLGTINMNEAKLYVNNQLVWQGMDDVGLDTRLDLSLSNINAAGEQKIKDIAGGGGGSEDIEEALRLLNGSDSTLLDTKEDKWIYGQEGSVSYRYNSKNGYCEQWGETDMVNAVGHYFYISLAKEYKTNSDTGKVEYNIQAIGIGREYAVNAMVSDWTGYQRTGKSFWPHVQVCGSNLSGDMGLMWRTYGFLAEGEY